MGHMNDLVGDLGELFGRAIRDGDDHAVPCLDLLHVAADLVEHPAAGSDRHDRKIFVDQGDRTMLHFPSRVALGMAVGDLLQLQGSFERDRIVDASSQV